MKLLPLLVLTLGACSGNDSTTGDDPGDDVGDDAPTGCTQAADTYESGDTAPSGCAILDRDASACEAEREAAGITGAWLLVSCRVELTKTSAGIVAIADGQPDYASNYYQTSNPCYATYAGMANPNKLSAQSLSITFPTEPNEAARPMMSAVVGMALNGVPIFGNFAAPGDDIYREALTFDKCAGHPQNTGVYHYHAEPTSLTYDDARFVGFMRDGYAIYGRRDADGTMPTLDTVGGHSGTTPDSTTAVYHYHVNEQTSSTAGTAGQKQWFLTTGMYRGAPGACTGC